MQQQIIGLEFLRIKIFFHALRMLPAGLFSLVLTFMNVLLTALKDRTVI